MSGLSKKIRFEVFKRDFFTCAYCGKTPPEVSLEVDHIDPVSKGGGNDLNNLVTSCFDCNRGKAAIPLKTIPYTIVDNLETLKEKEAQLKAYRKFVKAIQKREAEDIDSVELVFREHYPKDQFTERFKKNSVGMFLKKLPLHEVEGAMDLACNFLNKNAEKATKYFCGVCWNKIRERQ